MGELGPPPHRRLGGAGMPPGPAPPSLTRLIGVTRYWVSCRAALSGGAITHLRDTGIYRSAELVEKSTGPAGESRHYLSIEARDPEDALLIARGALAIAGASVDDLDVSDPPPDRSLPSR